MYTYSMIKIIFITIFSIYFYMSAWFLYALRIKNNSVADIAWGLGFILVALETLVLNSLYLPQQILATTLVIIWGTRLSSHIYMRNRNKPEDARYAAWRAQWGQHVVIRSYLQIFMLQGFILLLISAPIVLINTSNTGAITLYTIIGMLVWIIGFVFESVADYQLRQFLLNPANRGKIMKSGLWHYSRHPNYFGETLMWWGIFIIALSVPYGYFTIVSPIMITYLLLYVSGVPLLENKMRNNPEFQQYMKETSVFIPWSSKAKN